MENKIKLPSRNFWTNKKVIITGHTGFTGSWLSLVLMNFGANIYGVSLKPNTDPSLFEILKLKKNYLLKTLEKFKGLKYRQEIIFKSKYLTIINDSKSTSFSSSMSLLKTPLRHRCRRR